MFTEGEQTEVLYLLHWYRRHRDKVLVSIDAFHGGPLQLVERAVDRQRYEVREARRGRGRAPDEVWCVFDIDQHPNVPQAIDLAQAHGIELAISNSCIELWFILHFEDQAAYLDGAEARRRSKALLECEKVLTTRALEKLVEHFDEAVQRARKLDDKHAGDGSPVGANPSSSLWRLVEAIVDTDGL